MASTNFSLSSPPIFSGENYQIWAIKMKSYLQAFDLWDSVENNTDPTPLLENPTLAQIKIHNEERAKKYKAKTCIESSVSETIFIKIMACENAKEAWDLLKEEYEGNDQTRRHIKISCVVPPKGPKIRATSTPTATGNEADNIVVASSAAPQPETMKLMMMG
ncbi:hypothetical protein GH714_035579 [Hevea brasiliensis]|uniref:Uncharacterized protein n=1 Tax=Hevea brasiliensis TaxID=3981 RepID=A0A6A6L3K9_HEVBR|nr:hypothetical protein GH714_035579 [Hevea brasiliensis]